MTKLFNAAAVGLASMALIFGASACGESKTTTDTVTKTDPPVTTTESASTTAPTTSPEPDPNGVPPISPAKGTTQAAKCPSSAPKYDAATGLCYPNGAKMPE